MNAQEWSKLRKNWNELLELYPSEITSKLLQANAITFNDKEKVEKSGTTSEKMEKLLSILKSKPPDRNAFKALMKVLEEDECNSSLAEKIKATETSSDPSLTSQADPRLLDRKVGQVLQDNFENITGASIKLSEVREAIQKSSVFTGSNDWNNEVLLSFIKQEFVGVKDEKRRERFGKARRQVIYLQNIAKIDPARNETAAALEQKLDVGQRLKITATKSGVSDHGNYLSEEVSLPQKKGYLEEHDLPSGNPDDYAHEFTKGQLRENTPLPELKKYSEYLQKFDSDVTHTDKYIKGRCVDVSVNVRGKKTTPLRNYHLIPTQDKHNILEFIGSEVVPFASACINERRNGTIYFGISPNDFEKNKTGEIIGVNVLREEVKAEIDDFLKKSFLPSQMSIVASTIRDARFVPVVSDVSKDQEPNLWVVEVDVVPCSAALKNDIIKTKLAWLPIHAKKRRNPEAVFRFSDEGAPKIISSDEVHNYERNLEHIVRQRQDEEVHKHAQPPLNLRTKLLNLLTGGTEVMQDSLYLFLMTSPLDTHMNEEYLSVNMPFITQLNPEVVFDFDPSGSTEGIHKYLDESEVMRILTTDNFNKSQRTKEEYKEFIDGLSNESRIFWVFCNGYEGMNIDSFEPTEWNRRRKKAFQDSLRFFIDNFDADADRIIFIICLFSKNYKVLIEACDEVLTQLPENWMLLAESEDIAKLWQHEILARNKADKKALMDRSVIGMPWEQVNFTVLQAMDNDNLQNECHLPTSTGALVPVKEKKLKDWCDIDVLSAGKFDVHEGLKERKMKEVEVQFYRGQQASWLNFLFMDQVLKRDIHEGLMHNVRDALEGKYKEEEDMVTYVPVLHHPGAGGTTSGKQILWELRMMYRCCVVKTITNQTCDQLDELRRYSDSSPKPILILIDNEDEDKFFQLKGSLEEKGRKYWRHSDETFNVYCTIIHCIRRASIPNQIKHNEITLRQELTSRELDWFRDKNESLESRFNKDRVGNINPKFLISFNILRENFNKEYISKVVKEFSDDVKSTWEIKLLKIISLLNTYDPEFKPIHVSCLDTILGPNQNQRARQRQNTVKRNMNWEAKLSQAVKVLLNLSTSDNYSGKARSSVRIFNKIIAEEILTRIKERVDQKESEIMLELLESGAFEEESADSKHLQSVINNVMKKREFRLDGFKRNKFSKFVICVMEKEGAEVAVELLERLFELNQDPFTAQLISRFYIDVKNWNRAEYFAKKATGMFPSNSFLLDTYGQVYKQQLYDKTVSDGVRDEDIHDLIKLAENCIEIFRKEQEVSEREVTTNGENNFAGYFGELQAVVLLLSALKMCSSFSTGDVLHRYLVNEHFTPRDLRFLNKHESAFLKSLERNSKEAMRRLDEEYLQMKDSSNVMGNSNLPLDYDKKLLLSLKANLDDYFGEYSDHIPKNLNEPDTCEYTRRRARRLGASSLHNLLVLRQNGNKDKIIQAYFLMLKNISSISCKDDDLRMALDIVTVLLIDNYIPEGLEYHTVLEWCKKLYATAKPKEIGRRYLETFLYYILYNFPTKERQEYNVCLTVDLVSAIKLWYDAFKENYPKSEVEKISLKRRETTLFFLGNGPPLQDIVHQDSLIEMEQYTLTQKWDVPEVKQKLRMMSGTLLEHGERVNLIITTRDGNKFPISIPTSHKVKKKDMWQKKVYFYLGFSFSGPRAFGMSTEELGVTKALPQRSRQQAKMTAVQLKQESPQTLVALYRQKRETEDQLRKNPKMKTELMRKIQQIEDDIKKSMGV